MSQGQHLGEKKHRRVFSCHQGRVWTLCSVRQLQTRRGVLRDLRPCNGYESDFLARHRRATVEAIAHAKRAHRLNQMQLVPLATAAPAVMTPMTL